MAILTRYVSDVVIVLGTLTFILSFKRIHSTKEKIILRMLALILIIIGLVLKE